MRTWASLRVQKISPFRSSSRSRALKLSMYPYLPGRTWLDESGSGADRGAPLPDGPGDELRAVVGAGTGRDAVQDEEVGQDIDGVNGGKLPANPDRQALTGELVQDIEGSKGPPVMRPVMHEVVGPDMVGPFGAQPNTGAVVALPAGVAQQGGDPPVSVAAIPAGQLDHVCDQAILVVTPARDTALGRAVLPQHPAGAARGA